MIQPARRTFLPGHVVVIICSITIQLLNLARTIHLERYTWSYYQTASFAFLGLLFLSYPLLGYIADVCLTRYRTLKCSFIFLIVGLIVGLILSLVSITYSCRKGQQIYMGLPKYVNQTVILGVGTSAFLITTGVGLFEANAIQFGLDQLLELWLVFHCIDWSTNVVATSRKFECSLKCGWVCTSH